jgi:RNA polymerase sigma factor (sigma-70 family)
LWRSFSPLERQRSGGVIYYKHDIYNSCLKTAFSAVEYREDANRPAVPPAANFGRPDVFAREVKKLDLSDTSPGFLSRLDSDRDGAIAEFRHFAEKFFREAPPPNYLCVPPDDREDVVSEVILHCIEKDCARLRKYRPQPGSLFTGWFATVAYRKILDLLKRERNRNAHSPADDEDNRPSREPNPEQLAIHNELETIFLAALRRLGRTSPPSVGTK